MKTATCSTCGSEIEWVVTEKGCRMPVDAAPTPDGNITISMRSGPGQPGTAIYLNAAAKAELSDQARFRGEEPLFFKSHFATCPFADQHRKKRP